MDPLKVTQKLGQFLFYCDKCNNKLIRWDSWEQDPNRTCSGCQPAEGSAKDPAKDYVVTSGTGVRPLQQNAFSFSHKPLFCFPPPFPGPWAWRNSPFEATSSLGENWVNRLFTKATFVLMTNSLRANLHIGHLEVVKKVKQPWILKKKLA